MRTPSYIVKHSNGIYYFRYVIPKHQAHLFPNKREIRRTLNTRSRSLALKLARMQWVKLMTQTPHSSLEDNVAAWEAKMRNGKRIQDELAAYEASYQSTFDNTDRDEFLAHLSQYDYECLEAFSHNERAQSIATDSNESKANPATTTSSNKPLADLFDEYITDKGDIQDATKRGYKRHFKLFLKVTQVKTLDQVDIEVVRQYKSALPQLPPNLEQSKKLARLTIKQVLKMQHARTMSAKSVKLNASLVKSFLYWLFNQQYISADLSGPLNALKSRTNKKANSHRAVFTTPDLNSLFSVDDYQQHGFRKYSYKYWLPLLGLYTGARINELCQLDTKDVLKENDIYVLDINDRNGKKAKTKSAIRRIPLHKKLLELGFDNYVTHIKRLGEAKLFPKLPPNRDGDCSRKVSRFFNEQYKTGKGLVEYAGITKSTPNGVKVFHSLRHTFANQWKQQRLDSLMLKQIIGHASNDITYDTYGKDFDIKLIADEVNKLNFEITTHPIKWIPRFYR